MHIKEPQNVLTFTSIAKLICLFDFNITLIIKHNKSQINKFKQTLKNEMFLKIVSKTN